jgi:hypothetical protein
MAFMSIDTLQTGQADIGKQLNCSPATPSLPHVAAVTRKLYPLYPARSSSKMNLVTTMRRARGVCRASPLLPLKKGKQGFDHHPNLRIARQVSDSATCIPLAEDPTGTLDMFALDILGNIEYGHLGIR